MNPLIRRRLLPASASIVAVLPLALMPQAAHAQRRARFLLGITTEKLRYGRSTTALRPGYETEARGLQVGASYDTNRIGLTFPLTTERQEAVGAVYAEYLNYEGNRGRIRYEALGYQVRTRAFGPAAYLGLGAGLYNVHLSGVQYIYDPGTRARDGIGLGGKLFLGIESHDSVFAQVDVNLLDLGINPGLSLVIGSRLF